MPATAGRVRMPANNRVHSSAALQTHGIWQSAIGYDPYAPTKDKDATKASDDQAATGDAENAYASFQGLLALARITGSSSNETRGACKRCGRVGHLTFQCRNFLSVKDDKEKDGDVASSIQTANAVFEKIKKTSKKDGVESEPEEDENDESEEESLPSDSDVDPEIEKIIAARFGKKLKKKTTEEDSVRRGRSKKRSNREDDDSEDEEEEERRKEKRKKRHGTSDDDEDDQKRKHRKSRKDRKRRSHKKNEDSDESDEGSDRHRRHRHKRRNRRRDASSTESDSDDESTGDRKRSHRSERRRGRRAAPDSSSESDSSDKEDSSVRKDKRRIVDKKSRNHRKE